MIFTKGEKQTMWQKLPRAEGSKDMGANEILKKMGGGISMKVGSGSGEGEPKKAPAPGGGMTRKGVENTMEKSPKPGAGGGYSKATGNTEAAESPMAQALGSTRRGR